MTRLSIALTLLLMSFLATLAPMSGVQASVARAGVPGWLPGLLVAAAAVAFLFKAASVHRRMLFPRRGLRLLAAGIVLYAVGAALATGLVGRVVQWVPLEAGTPWAQVPELVRQVPALPFLAAAQVLLVVGAFRALCNLVPPSEFDADY